MGAEFTYLRRKNMSEAKLTVLLADDHQLVAEVLAAHLRSQGTFEAEVASSLTEALTMVDARGGYDVVLLDLCMPGMDGLNGLTRMIEANHNRPVALLSGNLPSSTVKQAMKLGASSCIPKTLPARSLVNAINFVAAGEIFLSAKILDSEVESDDPLGKLTAKERLVMDGLAVGLMNKEIGRKLSLSEATIKMYVRSICGKLGVKNRTQAALLATQVAEG